MNPTAVVALAAAGLSTGASTRISCPACGASAKTLSVFVTDSGAVVWNCFRGSCGWRGVTTRSGERWPSSEQPLPSRDTYDPVEVSMVPLLKEHIKFLEYKIGFSEEQVRDSGVMWCPLEHRFAFPVYDVQRMRTGWIMRSYRDGVTPKVISHNEYPLRRTMASFYACEAPLVDGVVVVVEDIPSAVRVSCYFDSVAILSSAAGLGVVHEMMRKYSKVVWALDKDAFRNSVELAAKYAPMFDKSVYYMIDKDFKNMTYDELEENCELIAANW